MPKINDEKNFIVRFRNIKNMLRQPFVIYSDFECIIKDEKHIPCGYCLYVVSQYDKFKFPLILYRGTSEEDTMNHFFDDILNLEKEIQHLVKINVPMIITEQDQIKIDKSTECYLCNKPLDGIKYRDHDHFTGEFRGVTHEKCNLNYNLKNYKIPVFFHNLKGYDGHLIVNAFTKYKNIRYINAISQSSEKYLSFSIGSLKFVDTFAFMSKSLDGLSSLLQKDKFVNLDKIFSDKSYLLKRKGIYPYEYMNSFDKFNEQKLPSINDFYSKLSGKTVKIEDYNYALNVWNIFNIKNLGEWHDLYLKTDVLLLADIFENFRNICMEYYKLDPSCYLTGPSLAWDQRFEISGTLFLLNSGTHREIF